jgi:hypothetical protein
LGSASETGSAGAGLHVILSLPLSSFPVSFSSPFTHFCIPLVILSSRLLLSGRQLPCDTASSPPWPLANRPKTWKDGRQKCGHPKAQVQEPRGPRSTRDRTWLYTFLSSPHPFPLLRPLPVYNVLVHILHAFFPPAHVISFYDHSHLPMSSVWSAAFFFCPCGAPFFFLFLRCRTSIAG